MIIQGIGHHLSPPMMALRWPTSETHAGSPHCKVKTITARTIYCIISLAAVMLPLMACAAPEPETRGIEVTGTAPQKAEIPVEVTRLAERTVEVPVTEIAEQTVEVPREAQTTVVVSPTAPPPTPEPEATSTTKSTPGTTPNPSGWTFFEGPYDPITGVKSHGLRTAGTVISPADYASLFRDPRLYLRCDGNLLEAYVSWGSRFIAENFRTETIATVYKVDDETPVNTTSDESVDNESSFFTDPTRFVLDLIDTEKVAIRVTSYDNTEMTAVFTTAALSTDVPKLSCWR